MRNLKTSQQELEQTIQTSKKINIIKQSVALAFERTNTPVFNLDNLSSDIESEFKKQDINVITNAIRNGSLGVYGRTYRLSTQEVCIWIREYIKENKNKATYTNPYKEAGQL